MYNLVLKMKQKAIYVHRFSQTNSATQVQCLFTAENNHPPSSRPTFYAWRRRFLEVSTIQHRGSNGSPYNSIDNVQRIKMYIDVYHTQSLRRDFLDLDFSHESIHRVLR